MNEKALLVEDDPSLCVVLSTRLKAAGYSVHYVHTLKDALAYAKENEIGITLLDLQLPDSKGFETFRVFRNYAASFPVIVMTGNDDEELALRTMKNGAQDYIVKGKWDSDLLVRVIRHAIERHRVKRELETVNQELKLANVRLENLALIDPLTELLNRRGLQKILSREINWAKRQQLGFIVMIVDIDNFKKINDNLGHAAGDILLKETAKQIKHALRSTDYVARIGGDEFMIILPQTRLPDGIRVAERIRLGIAEDNVIYVANNDVKITVSIGLGKVFHGTPSIDELLSRTHLVLKKSKDSGKNCVSFEDGSKSINLLEGKGISSILEALKSGEHIRPVKQAIMNLQEEKPVGYEFLSRLKIPGFSMPDDFFRISLQNNILPLVDHHCLRVCSKAAASLNDSDGRVHLNLFPSTIISIPVEHLLEDFRNVGLLKKDMCVEISEQQILGDSLNLLRPIQALKDAGIKIAIDDIGFGRSCMESVIDLEPHIIKIDKKCVINIAKNPSLIKSMKRILKVFRALDSEIIAEGIETKEDLKVLQDLGVVFGQGYYFGKPA